jgi:hypothetical protein
MTERATMIKYLLKKINAIYIFLLTKFYIFEEKISSNNKGLGVIEIVLIILVLVGLIVIFKDNITKVINTVFTKLNEQIDTF